MSSNIKPKTSAKEAPTEPFKRAVAGCMRAIARKPELEVSFAAERPGLAGGKARLPEPPRKLTPQDAAIVRGHADSIALQLACHDPAVHRRLMPGGQQARAVFEAVEQARVEAIGARRMQGVAQNLARHARRQVPSRQVRRHHRPRRCADRGRGRDDGARAPDRPGAAARRAQAGRSVAPAASRSAPGAISTGWRSWSRTSAASATRSMTCSTRSTWATSAARDSDDEDDEDDGDRTSSRDQTARRARAQESEDADGMSIEEAEVVRRRTAGRRRARRWTRRPPTCPTTPTWAIRRPPTSRGGRASMARTSRAGRLSALHRQVRRDHRGRGSVRAGRARPAARLSRQAALASAGRGGAPRQPAAAPPDGAAEPRLGVRPRRGPARSGAAARASSSIRCIRCRSSARRTPTSATPW